MKIRLTESELIRLIKNITENIDNEEFTGSFDMVPEKNLEIEESFNDLVNILQFHGYDKSELMDSDHEQLLMMLGDVIDDLEPGRERKGLEVLYDDLGRLLYDVEYEGEKIYEDIYGSVESVNLLNEAEYKGRKVKLGKPFLTPGGPKKRSVYVKNDKGNVVKVNFGDPNMRIKVQSPKHRKSFRARHNCQNPGPRWKPKFWSCKAW